MAEKQTITSGNLQAIRIRADKATIGPWKVFEQDHEPGKPHLAERRIGTVWDHPQSHESFPIVTLGTCRYAPHHRVLMCEEDAEFIAHAREDIPNLLAYTHELERKLDNLKMTVWDVLGYNDAEYVIKEYTARIEGEGISDDQSK